MTVLLIYRHFAGIAAVDALEQGMRFGVTALIYADVSLTDVRDWPFAEKEKSHIEQEKRIGP